MPTRRIKRTASRLGFWLVIAYFGIALVVVALWVGFSRISAENARQARTEAIHHADIVATADAQYAQCVKSIPLLKHVNGFVASARDVDVVLLKNSRASHAATPAGSELYRQQIINIKRLQHALRSAAQVRLKVPTQEQCSRLKRDLLHRP